MKLRARRLSCTLSQECGRTRQRLLGQHLSAPALPQRRRQVTSPSPPGYMSIPAHPPGSSIKFRSLRPGRRPRGRVALAVARVPTRHCLGSASLRLGAVLRTVLRADAPTPDRRVHGLAVEARRTAPLGPRAPQHVALGIPLRLHRSRRRIRRARREPAVGCRWWPEAVWFSSSGVAAGLDCADATPGCRCLGNA
jgi:hypothetical protein